MLTLRLFVPCFACARLTGRCVRAKVGDQSPRKNLNSHIDASHSRQPLVKGERLVRCEVNAVMSWNGALRRSRSRKAELCRLEALAQRLQLTLGRCLVAVSFLLDGCSRCQDVVGLEFGV